MEVDCINIYLLDPRSATGKILRNDKDVELSNPRRATNPVSAMDLIESLIYAVELRAEIVRILSASVRTTSERGRV